MRHSEPFENDFVHINPVGSFGAAKTKPNSFQIATRIAQELASEGYIEDDVQIDVANEIMGILDQEL